MTRVKVGRKLVPLSEATLSQLQIAALKAFPSSPYQREIRAEIDKRHARGEKTWLPPKRSNPSYHVAEEGPNEHLRNALAMLMHFPGKTTDEQSDTLAAITRRVTEALDQLEHRRVNIPLSRRRNHRSVRLKNPALAVLGANPRVEDATLATWAKIEYIRPDDPDGKRIIRVHEFKDGFEIGWLSDGSVQLSHPKHPLWMEDDH